MEYKRCYAVVSLPAIRENLMQVKSRLEPGVSLLTVVKANAYGHGSVEVAKYTEDISDIFGVACLEEAVELRKAGIERPIMILGYTSPSQYETLLRYNISPTIYNYDEAVLLSQAAMRMNTLALVHIALDTGMTRIGFRASKESLRKIIDISNLPNIDLTGIFTHLSCADMAGDAAAEHTKMQLDEFDYMLEILNYSHIDFEFVHAFNSAAIMEQDNRGYTCARSAIVTYGMYPSDEVDKNALKLQSALSWYAHVINIADVEEGRPVSYGATFTTKRPVTRIATVSAGYADGYPRLLSNKGRVLINGQYAPIIGRVCMDQFMVDATDIADIEIEDTVTLIGRDGENEITADEIADLTGTINYEVTCDISPRVERIYKKA